MSAEAPHGADAPRPPARARGVALVLLFLVSATSYADRAVMSVLQEPIKTDLKLSDVELGLLGGPVFAIVYALVGLPIARQAERSSRKRIVAAMVALWSALTACCGLAHSFLQMALMRVGVGAAESGSPPASHSLVADYFPPERRGRAMSVLQLGVPLGTTAGGLAAGLVAQSYGWRWGFIAVGLPGVALSAALAVLLREPARGARASDAPSTAWRAVMTLLGNRAFCFLLAAGALGGNASHGLDTFLGSFFIRRYGFTLQQIGGLFALARGGAGVAGALAGGVLADHFARGSLRAYAWVPGISSACAGVMFLIAFNAPDVGLGLVGLFSGYFFLNMLPSPTYAAVQNLAGDAVRATAAALYFFCLTVVGSLAPPLVGFVSDTVAGRAFPAALGAFRLSCPGGHALAGASAEMARACAAASAGGLRTGLLIPPVVLLTGLLAYGLAAKAMPRAASGARL